MLVQVIFKSDDILKFVSGHNKEVISCNAFWFTLFLIWMNFCSGEISDSLYEHCGKGFFMKSEMISEMKSEMKDDE